MDFNAIKEMLGKFGDMTLGDALSAILLVIFAISLIGGLINGLSRGIQKQGLHILCTLCAAFFSYFVIGGLTQVFVDSFNTATIAELLSGIGMNAELAGYLNGVTWLLALPIGTIVVPVMFVVFFLFMKVGAAIMYRIMRGVLSLPKKEKGALNKVGAMLVGAVEGLICFTIILLPFSGALGIFDSGVKELRAKENIAYSDFFAFYDEAVTPVVDSIPLKTTEILGSEAILDSFATVEDRESGKKINLRREVVSAVSLVTEVSMMKDVNWKALSKDHQLALDSAVETIGSSKYLSVSIASILNSMAVAIDNGVIPFSLEAPFDTLVNSVVSLFASVDEYSVEDDISSILSVYYILCDDGVLEVLGSGDSDAIVELLTTEKNGTTVINKVIAELKKNENTKPLVATLTELSVTIMSSQLGVGENSAEVYNNVKDGLKEVLTIKPSDYADTEEGHAQYKEDLTNALDDKFQENGIELEPEIVGGIADYIDENIEVKDEYTDEEINDIILSYYDVYLEYQKNGTIPDGIPDGVIPE